MAMFQRFCIFTALVIALFICTTASMAFSLQNVTAVDRPDDKGDAIVLTWQPVSEDQSAQIQEHQILRAESIDGPFTMIAITEADASAFVDTGKEFINPHSGPDSDPITVGLKAKHDYYYQVVRVNAGAEYRSAVLGPVQATPQWIHRGKAPIMFGTIAFFLAVAIFIQLARQGKAAYVRPISGMDEIDNAIGRATEMGRPILYVLGLGAPDEIATIASYTILARVARKTAEYRTNLIVPCNEPIVMTIAQDTVKNAYIEAGHPDAYNEDMVYYVTSLQFAYVAAVNGIMLRERTATNCYFGKFYAESLLLSETGNIAGSIQVAGTDEVAQLPFFVTTCDYTLIGEELYAASAYLGRDPLLLGALKAQDLAKATIMILIIIGSILMSMDIDWLKELITVKV